MTKASHDVPSGSVLLPGPLFSVPVLALLSQIFLEEAVPSLRASLVSPMASFPGVLMESVKDKTGVTYQQSNAQIQMSRQGVVAKRWRAHIYDYTGCCFVS